MSDTTRIQVRMKKSTADVARGLAIERGQSLSEWVRGLIADAIEKRRIDCATRRAEWKN